MGKADSAAVLKASDCLNSQPSSVMQLDSSEALCMEYHVNYNVGSMTMYTSADLQVQHLGTKYMW